MEPRSFQYQSMGTGWGITIWDSLGDDAFSEIEKTIVGRSQVFDQTYSRFIKTSLIWELTEKTGTVEVPLQLVEMLRLYETLYDASHGFCNPLIGYTLSDMGYDAQYSLKPKEIIRTVPPLHDVLTIVDDTHIHLTQHVLIDLGALGKGFFVDVIAEYLKEKDIARFLVNGSGDIYYQGNGIPLRAGLEHPGDTTKAIGVLELLEGGLCASAGNRRRWATYQHTINPFSLTSPEEIIATWVQADTAALADGLATCLFMVEPETLQKDLSFDYCLLNKDYRVKKSEGFEAEFF